MYTDNGERLFANLKLLCSSVKPETYKNSEGWIIQDLKDDLHLGREWYGEKLFLELKAMAPNIKKKTYRNSKGWIVEDIYADINYAIGEEIKIIKNLLKVL